MQTRFGVTLQSGPEPISFARLAESAGFDYLACGEHLAFHGPTTNAFISLSVAAGATQKIGLVSAVTVLPLYPPVMAAKLAMSLDVASGGRFTFGVGVGGEYPPEFAAAGVPLRQRGARTDEALEILHRLMTEDDVTVQGKFTSFSSLTLAPKALQKPRVPIWIAGRREASMRRAARFGDGWMPYLCTPEQLAAGIQVIDQAVRERGGAGWSGRNVLFAFITVDHDGSLARRVAMERVGHLYKRDFSRLAGKYLVAGTPAECAQRLREYCDAGADVVLFRLTCARQDAERMLRLIAEEVIPELRGSSSPSGQ